MVERQLPKLHTSLHTADHISTWVGKAAAWLIVVLMLLVCAEVFKRYATKRVIQLNGCSTRIEQGGIRDPVAGLH